MVKRGDKSKMFGMKRKNLTGIIIGAIGLMLMVIMVLQVVQPTVNTAITSTSANLTGYTGAQTLAYQIPLILVVVVLLGALSYGLSFMRGMGV